MPKEYHTGKHALIRRTKSAPTLLARCGSSRYCWRAAGAVATLHQLSGVRSTSCGCQSRLLYMLSRHFTTSSALVNAIPVPLVVTAQKATGGDEEEHGCKHMHGCRDSRHMFSHLGWRPHQVGKQVYIAVRHQHLVQFVVSCTCCFSAGSVPNECRSTHQRADEMP